VTAGRINVAGKDVTGLPAKNFERLLGRQIGFIFQDPDAALDPTIPVSRQVGESLEGQGMSRARRRRRVLELLARVGIPDAPNRIDDYPHQFSGGMKQRALIASALASDPQVLIADEPTSALDVTVQAQILALLNELSTDMGLAVLFITHDLAVARAIASRVCVMYAGRLVEHGPAASLLSAPHHPYTQALLDLAPRFDAARSVLPPIAGSAVPGWLAGDACPFAARCNYAESRCTTTRFQLRPLNSDSDHASGCLIPRGERRRHGGERAV
jgi:oligopeptide/dipeptide ABC transporter ATP-binding protein